MGFQYFPSSWFSWTPNSMTLITTTLILLSFVLTLVVKRIKFVKLVNRVPGMYGGLTLLGNASILLVSVEEIFQRVLGYIVALQSEGPLLRAWAGPIPLFFLFTTEAFEVVLSSNKLIDKSSEYGFLHQWLSTGLLTSTGSKWFTRRKMLTPTFHFKILEDFLHVFNEQSQLMIKLLKEASLTNKKGINIYPYITRCALDIICESAMGCKVHAQTKIDGKYVQAVYSMCQIFQTRTIRPWLRPDFLFNISSVGAQQRENLKILHGFTDSVIASRKIERKQEIEKIPDSSVSPNNKEEDNFTSRKRRLAFLDLLLDASDDGKVLSDTDIREEVDTIMFEGHDTSTAAVNWLLHLVGSHPGVQERIQEEINHVFGDDSERPATTHDLNELKYLECCIKETLRLYPSVPMMGRQLSEDTVIHGYTIPAKSNVLLFTYLLHRDPKTFPDPELYKPERFLEDSIKDRHPYSYVPFSAGPRNCIGQKFAMMEQKVILSTIFRNFHVKALDKRDELTLLNDVILRPMNGIHVHLTPKT